LGAAAILASAYFVAYGVSQPLWGALSERVGRMPVLRGAVVGGGLSCMLAAATTDFGVLVAARTVAGLCFGALVPTAITYLGDTLRAERRQHALAVLMAFATAGVAAGTIFGGVAAQLLSWRVAFIASAVLAVPLTVALWTLREPGHGVARAPLRGRVRALGREPWVAVVVGLALLEGVVVFGSLTFVAAALQDGGVGAAVAGSAAAGFGIANVLCTPLVTRAIPRVPGPALIAGGAALAGAGLLLAGIRTTVLTATGATLALGAGFGFLHSTMQLWATQVHAQSRALVVSLFASALFTGAAIASAAAAPLADDGRFSLIFLLAAAGAALLAIAGSALRRRWHAAGRAEAGAEPEPVAP
jgi:predicted MFS family arabinose efflux permease